MALAWLLPSLQACPNCGTNSDEWRGEDGRSHADPPPYDFVPVDCLGCATKQRTQEAWPDNVRGSRRLVARRRTAPPNDDGE